MFRVRKVALLEVVVAVTLLVSYQWNSFKSGFEYGYAVCETPLNTGIIDENTTSNDATTTIGAENYTVDIMEVNKVAGVWHSVMKRKVIVFSAYWDDRINQNSTEVKVIAELNCKSEKIFFCKLYFTHNLRTTVEAKVKLINSGCSQEYEAHFIVCPIPNSLVRSYPTTLQLFPNANVPIGLTKVTPHLAINYPPTKIEHKLAICVGRMYDFRDWLQLAFFIEFYKLMGATKFVFYTRSHTKDVESILNYYEQDGLIDVIPFPIAPDSDLVSSSDIERGTHVTFQLLQMTDCSYWLREKAKFAANIDVDEFILPNGNNTLLELLEKNDVDRDWDGFLFRSRYYQQNWPDKLSLKRGDSVLRCFANVSKIVYPHSIPCSFGYRDKSVNKPNLIVRVSTHGIHESLKPNPLLKQIDLDQAVIFHLRKMGPTEKPVKSKGTGVSYQCLFATDNVPVENPFAQHFDKLIEGLRTTVGDIKQQ